MKQYFKIVVTIIISNFCLLEIELCSEKRLWTHLRNVSEVEANKKG